MLARVQSQELAFIVAEMCTALLMFTGTARALRLKADFLGERRSNE